ncbi:hypothetical protein [Paenibacillus pabuli]|uniref:hypothetical protein n=1 Tax=Paenibacillus pabuli TaxID=1472 RepID=UPI003CE93CAE
MLIYSNRILHQFRNNVLNIHYAYSYGLTFAMIARITAGILFSRKIETEDNPE